MENKTGYSFQENGHSHYFDGKRMTGITTVLGVIAKPFLINWAANEAVDCIKNRFEISDRVIRPIRADDGKNVVYWYEVAKPIFESILEEARISHRKKKEEAGQKGTDIHALIEKRINGAIKNNNGFINKEAIDENEQVQKFILWSQDNNVKFLEVEKHIYSEKLWLGGVCDFVCEIDGEAWIGDIKTGSGIYAEAFFQTAGYQILFEEMGLYPNIKGHLILNLKKTGEFLEKRSISNEDNKNAFLSALNLYRVIEKINGQIINK